VYILYLIKYTVSYNYISYYPISYILSSRNSRNFIIDSFSQRLKKAINYITPHCIEQSEYAKRIFDLQNDIEDDLKTKAQRKASKELKVSEKIEGYVTVPSVTVAQQKTGKNVKRIKDNSETKKKSKK
jgi:hypothetical protein